MSRLPSTTVALMRWAVLDARERPTGPRPLSPATRRELVDLENALEPDTLAGELRANLRALWAAANVGELDMSEVTEALGHAIRQADLLESAMMAAADLRQRLSDADIYDAMTSGTARAGGQGAKENGA